MAKPSGIVISALDNACIICPSDAVLPPTKGRSALVIARNGLINFIRSTNFQKSFFKGYIRIQMKQCLHNTIDKNAFITAFPIDTNSSLLYHKARFKQIFNQHIKEKSIC